MKIAHLLEYPQAVAPDSPLGKARAKEAGASTTQPKPAAPPVTTNAPKGTVGGIPNPSAGLPPGIKMTSGTGAYSAANPYKQAGTSTTPTSTTAPATPNPATTTPATTTEPPASTSQPGAFNNMVKDLGGDKTAPPDLDTGNKIVNRADPNNPNVKPQEPGALDKFKNWASSDQSGADITKFGRGMRDAGSALNKGAQGVIGGVSDLAGSAIRGVGNVASQAAGGVTQTLGAAAGGLAHGYQTARRGGAFKQAAQDATGYTPALQRPSNDEISSGAGSTTGGAGGAGGDEIAQLKSTLQTMDQRLRKAGL